MLETRSEQNSKPATTANKITQLEYEKLVQEMLLCHKRQAAHTTDQFHTVKNCLQNISGMLQVLTRQCELKHIETEFMQSVCQEINRTIKSLNNYLQNSQETSIPCLYSLNQLVTEVIQSQQTQFAFHQIKLKSKLAENIPKLMLNKQYMRKVLINCLDNSRDAILAKNKADGQILISTMFDKKQKIVHLLIEDNGIGLGAEQQANFFLPHYTTKPSGSGLGTCFCQTIVKMHGGYVSVNGQPNIGCCVRIDLPLINRNHFTSNDYYNEVADTIF